MSALSQPSLGDTSREKKSYVQCSVRGHSAAAVILVADNQPLICQNSQSNGDSSPQGHVSLPISIPHQCSFIFPSTLDASELPTK